VQSASFEQRILDVSAHDVVSTGTVLPRSGGQLCATDLCACGMAMALPHAWPSEMAEASKSLEASASPDVRETVLVLPHETHKHTPMAKTFVRFMALLGGLCEAL
jgi:hypothetical protein